MSALLRSRRWLPSRQLARRSRGLLLGGISLRVLTRWRRSDLDRQLAAGTDPMLSDELSLRVGQLGAPQIRLRLSRELRDAVEVATGRRRPLFGTRLRLAEIQESEDLMLALSERLGSGEPLGIQGLALTACLVNHRRSALYRSSTDDSLPARLMEALQALERGQRTAGSTGR
jgi:hypothetical protein